MYSVNLLASLLSPLPGSSVQPQSNGKGKHRVGTSPSAVPAKRSVQGDDKEEEVTAGSAVKRRRKERSHMTCHMTGEDISTNTLIECWTRRAYGADILWV